MVLKDLTSLQLLKVHRKYLIKCAEITDILFARQTKFRERHEVILEPIDIDIVAATIKVFKITLEQFHSKSHARRLSNARIVACYCLRQLSFPYNEIGQKMGLSADDCRKRVERCKLAMAKDPRVQLWVQAVFQEAGA